MSDELILRLRALAARPDDVSEVGCLWKLYAASCEAGDLMSAEIERLRAENAKLRAEVERLRAEVARYKAEPALLRAELIAITNASRKALSDAYDRARASRPDAHEEEG